MQMLYNVVGWLWANVIGYVLLGVGAFYTIKLGFPQIKHFKRAIRTMKDSLQGEGGGVSGFGTLMAALGGQLGTGSLVGVSSALVAGGPGAIFWMWVTALLGMSISIGETTLGQIFRVKEKDGSYTGGPSFYIEKGLGNKPMAILMAILYVFGVGIAISSLQTNSIANAFSGVVDINPIIPGIVVVILAYIIIIGGIKRLSDVASLVVPFMVIVYFAIVLYILVANIAIIPSIFASIFKSAFTGKAAMGGVIGWTVADAFRNGMARGLFSNDAGNGCAAIMHASADVKHPIDQGLLGMTGTFITTIIVCTCTALAILLTGSLESGNDGILLLQTAFNSVLGSFGSWIVFFAMFLFGFTTLLADIYYGEANLTYIFKEKDKGPIWIYRIILAVVLVISSVTDLNAIWATVDLFVGLIVFTNIIAMILLSKYVKYVYDNYFYQVKKGIEYPRWNYDMDIMDIDLSNIGEVKNK